MKAIYLLLIPFLLFQYSCLLSEEMPSGESTAKVQELIDFHEVIATIWHTAWPEQNIIMLKELFPEVESGSAKVISAKLPGILRDKQANWDKGIQLLGEIVAEYKTAVKNDDSVALMNTAERLHSQFEKLIRTIKPAMKEIDEYHVELYKLYHYYLPDYNFEKIKESVKILMNKMGILLKAEVPKRLKNKEAFEEAIKALAGSLETLSIVVKQGDNKSEIAKSVEAMHSKYQALEAVFD